MQSTSQDSQLSRSLDSKSLTDFYFPLLKDEVVSTMIQSSVYETLRYSSNSKMSLSLGLEPLTERETVGGVKFRKLLVIVR